MAERQKIWGPPGTGKTRKLIDICKVEMVDGRIPQEIIFCTFTKPAAREAIKRAMDEFGYTRDSFPWFSTEHSICFRLLGLKRNQVFTSRRVREFAKVYRYNFSTEGKDDDAEERFSYVLLKTDADHFEAFCSYQANRMLSFDEAYRQFIRGRDDLPDGFNRPRLQDYIERRDKYKRENGLWSFDDMIVAALQQDLFPPGATVLVADEMQDSSPLLYELVRRWADKVDNYYIAADPLQSIFSFAGASPDLFFGFPGEEEVLGHSWRLTAPVKNFAGRIIQKTGLPFPEYTTTDRAGELKQMPYTRVNWEDAGDCFVLARTRWLLHLLSEHFMTLGIPYRNEKGRHSAMEDNKGEAFLALLRLNDGEQVTERDLRSIVKFTGPPYIERGTISRVKELPQGEYQGGDLRSLGFTDAFMSAIGHGYGEQCATVLCKNMDGLERRYLTRVLKRFGREAFEQEPKITLSTIHGSKGREKSTVYLSADMTRKTFDTYIKDKNSECMVAYVGATRAIDKLVILSPQQEYSFPYPSVTGECDGLL